MKNAQMDVVQQNMFFRNMLIETGLFMTKKLQPVTADRMGSTIRVPLDRLGITTGVLLQISVPVTLAATGGASPYGPYNLVQQITYTDYSGLNRVNTSGWMLHALSCFRANNIMNNAFNGVFLPTSELGLDTNILNFPDGVSDPNNVLTFFLYVPFAIDPQADLRGAVLAQTIYGDHYITIQLPPALTGADPLLFPYQTNNATIAANQKITIQAFQNYIMPQSQNFAANMPMIDLSTIYAVEGGTTDSANITAGSDKYLNWPNNRAILSALHVFNNGGASTPLNGTDVTDIVLLGNGNTSIREMTPATLRLHMRYMLGSDFPSGVYYMPSRRQPITTQLYGNVQTRFTLKTVNAGAYFSSQYESTYLAGTPLPGIIQ